MTAEGNYDNFSLATGGFAFTIEKNLIPGEYYLFVFFNLSTWYCWGWGDGKNVSVSSKVLSYTNCKQVESFLGPKYVAPVASDGKEKI
jgi:hypothetical protein